MWRGLMRAWHGLQAKVRAIEDIPCPTIEGPHSDDLPSVIALDPRFQDTVRWFAQDPTHSRSLLSPDAQALLFAIVRNLKPEHVFEIGTFRAGTTEAIARAMYANAAGTVHTVDPFGMPQVPAILLRWPRKMRHHVRFYPIDSMAFHMEATRLNLISDLTFIDGHHDYEFVLFDLNAASRSIAPGGFVILDNYSQPGPYLAIKDFCASTLGWRHSGTDAPVRPLRPFDRHRTAIVNTDFAVLKAPSDLFIGSRPVAFGARPFSGRRIRGVRLARKSPLSSGTLSVQCILRGHAQATPVLELLGGATVKVNGVAGPLSIEFDPPLIAEGQLDTITAEAILVWKGPGSLVLIEPPEVF
jgi:predicted O-methyltransferase YrrM